MRSDRDKRTDSEKEIDDFLSQFETPVDELSADINSYLDEDITDGSSPDKSFLWVDHPDDIKSIRQKEIKQRAKSASHGAGPVSQQTVPADPDADFPSEGRRASHAVQPPEGRHAAHAVQPPEDKHAAHAVQSPEGKHAAHTAQDGNLIAAAGAAVSEQLRPVTKYDAAADEGSAPSLQQNMQPESRHEPATVKSRSVGKVTTSSYKAGKEVKKRVRKASGKVKKSTFISTAAAGKMLSKIKKVNRKKLNEKLFLKPNPKFDPSQPVGRGNKPNKISIKKLFLDLVGVGMLCVLGFLIFALSCIATAPKYDFKDVYSVVDTSSIIYDDEGEQVDSVFYTQNRKVIKYDDMPENLINSFIAIEDKTFWKHHGFNWTRMIGAILSSFTGHGRISGTSTITQQLSRNVYLADIKSQRSIKRKILEMYYAARLEHALSKEEIIEAYLNTIYLGHGCYGVNAAAKTYFSKSVKKLNLEQCAALAALPQAPEDYALLKFADDVGTTAEDSEIVAREPDTIVTNDTSRNRRDLTLRLMLDQGYITQEEYDDNVDKSVNSFIKPTITTGNGNYSYYHEYLVDTVIHDLMKEFDMEYEDAERMVYTRGLRIYSTMDSQAQNVVAEEFQDASNFPSLTALYNTDYDGNMLNNDGDIALYKYDNDFDEDGDFTLDDDEVDFNDDGSVTILKDKKLYIYETQVGDGTDYSLEFKDYYRVVDDKLYSIQGGYINIPSTYKSLDGDGNLVVSAQYFEDYGDSAKKTDDGIVFKKDSYSLSSMTLQPQGAMVIVENGTGKVKAMVGGRAFKGQKLLNRALNARQPGSSIKPLAVYGAALQKSYELAEKGEKWNFINFEIDRQGTRGWGDYVTVHSSIEDERTYIEDRYWPNNYSRTFTGKNTFKTAIQKSINTCAVKLQLQIGNEFSMNQLEKFGITTAIDDESKEANDMNPAALALGAMCEGVKPLEMALAYAAFPAGGQVNSAICYTKVEDRNGDILLKGESEATEAINEGVAFIMTDVLQSVVKANGYIHLDDVQPGGKTGTTNDKYDLWFDGFTPSYAASLWIGTDMNVEMNAESFQTAQFWGKIMNQIPKALEGSYPKQPSNVISRYGEYFTEGTETGLTSWSSEDERKKRIAAARQKWQAERKNHKVWVEEKGHYETRVVSPETYKTETYEEEEEYIDEDGEIRTRKVTKERQVIDKPAVTEKVWVVDKKAHWEYEKGWRDGDFHYNGN